MPTERPRTSQVFNVVHNSVVMRGTFYGLGAWDSQTNSATKMEGKKVYTAHRNFQTLAQHEITSASDVQYVFLWQLFYAIDLAFVKTSILATMKRIATAKVYLRIIWGLIILSAAISTAGVVVILINCKPIAANWDSSLGSCISPVFFVSVKLLILRSSAPWWKLEPSARSSRFHLFLSQPRLKSVVN